MPALLTRATAPAAGASAPVLLVVEKRLDLLVLSAILYSAVAYTVYALRSAHADACAVQRQRIKVTSALLITYASGAAPRSFIPQPGTPYASGELYIAARDEIDVSADPTVPRYLTNQARALIHDPLKRVTPIVGMWAHLGRPTPILDGVCPCLRD